jgi:hypothetical protein
MPLMVVLQAAEGAVAAETCLADVDEGVRRLRVLAEDADERHQGQQRGEEGQDRVVGQRGGPVGEVVVLELDVGPLEDRPAPGAGMSSDPSGRRCAS